MLSTCEQPPPPADRLAWSLSGQTLCLACAYVTCAHRVIVEAAVTTLCDWCGGELLPPADTAGAVEGIVNRMGGEPMEGNKPWPSCDFCEAPANFECCHGRACAPCYDLLEDLHQSDDDGMPDDFEPSILTRPSDADIAAALPDYRGPMNFYQEAVTHFTEEFGAHVTLCCKFVWFKRESREVAYEMLHTVDHLALPLRPWGASKLAAAIAPLLWAQLGGEA